MSIPKLYFAPLVLTCLLFLCLAGCGSKQSQPQQPRSEINRTDKAADFNGFWEMDYSQSDNIQIKLNALVRDVRQHNRQRSQGSGYQQSGPGMVIGGGSTTNTGASVIGLAQMAELITESQLLEIKQDEHNIKVKRELDFALTCEFYLGQYHTVETPLGKEICGWKQHQLIFKTILPEGLTIQHVMSVGPDRQWLNLATTVTSDQVTSPFTVNRVYARYEPQDTGYRCKMTISPGAGYAQQNGSDETMAAGVSSWPAVLFIGTGDHRCAVQGDDGTDPALAVASVGNVTLRVERSVSEANLLDVGLAIFDPGIPLDAASHSKLGIFPEIRKAEAQFMPVLLRQVLMQTNAWGVVRVLPDEQLFSELLVTGKIRRSSGSYLVLEVRARDATGQLWLDKSYRDNTTERDYPGTEGSDPFIDLYKQIANDLLAYRLTLSTGQISAIRQAALMRYAASLSQEAFGSYLQRDAQGIYTVVRLPGQGDPMMARVERIRNQEHLFVDTVDEQYVNLYEEMAPTYNLWRQYGREQALYQEDYEVRAQNKERIGRRGSFSAMEQTYNTYKQIKIQEQDLDEMALGFNNEVAPTAMEASGRVFRLSGNLQTQYNEWRSILKEIFAIETGLPAGS